jgi:hypothetical protein
MFVVLPNNGNVHAEDGWQYPVNTRIAYKRMFMHFMRYVFLFSLFVTMAHIVLSLTILFVVTVLLLAGFIKLQSRIRTRSTMCLPVQS